MNTNNANNRKDTAMNDNNMNIMKNGNKNSIYNVSPVPDGGKNDKPHSLSLSLPLLVPLHARFINTNYEDYNTPPSLIVLLACSI